MKMNLILLAPPLCVFVCVFLLCLVNVLKCKLALLNNVCKAEEKLQLRWQTLDMPLLTNLHTDSLSVRLSVWSPRRLLQPHFSILRQQSASFSSPLLTHICWTPALHSGCDWSFYSILVQPWRCISSDGLHTHADLRRVIPHSQCWSSFLPLNESEI